MADLNKGNISDYNPPERGFNDPVIGGQKEIIDDEKTGSISKYATELRITKTRGLRGYEVPVTVRFPGTSFSSTSFACTFFIADSNCQVLEAYYRHETANTSGGTATHIAVMKYADGSGGGSGTEIGATRFSTTAGASMMQKMLMKFSNNVNTLHVGDALFLGTDDTGFASLANICVTVIIRYI
jgi:hypothetical protein